MSVRTKELAIVDVETTGGNASSNRIIEIAVIRVSGGELKETFSTLINPETSVPPFVAWLTGIRGADLRGAPLFADIKDRLLELFDGALFVAHNARFDYSFVRSEFEREGVTFSPQLLCTMRLSRHLFPQFRQHGLDSIIGRHGITVAERHRALGDARAVWDFLRQLDTSYGSERLTDALTRVLKKPAAPMLISQSLLDGLPERPGVYIFYDSQGTPLYVGKSINVKSRVLSHFSVEEDSIRSEILRKTVTDIEVVPMMGELGALLMEASHIKKLAPALNKRSRPGKKIVIARRVKGKEGYETVEVVSVARLPVNEIGRIVGVFKSQKQAREVLWQALRTHRLCPRIMGLEKGEGSCAYRPLGRCEGACSGEERPASYNRRFDLAFRDQGIRQWPFKGPVAVIEYGPKRTTGDVFIVDRWCVIDAFRFDETGQWRLFKGDSSLNYEAYKILVSYVNRQRNRVTIRELNEAELASIE